MYGSRIQLLLKRFPDSSISSGWCQEEPSGHQNLVSIFPWIDNCLMVTKRWRLVVYLMVLECSHIHIITILGIIKPILHLCHKGACCCGWIQSKRSVFCSFLNIAKDKDMGPWEPAVDRSRLMNLHKKSTRTILLADDVRRDRRI